MGEWALPPDETVVFTELLHDAVAQHEPAARWLRGGFWRNFQVKYREINDLHKQMLADVARRSRRCPRGRRGRAALDHLHRGQSNDCYWHGLFGGIYISHMRLATLRAPDRRRGRRRRGRWATAVAAELAATWTWTAATRSCLADARPGRDRQAVRGRRHRRVGHPGRAPRAGRGAAPPARGLPRRPCARHEAEGAAGGRPRRRRTTAAPPPRSTTS